MPVKTAGKVMIAATATVAARRVVIFPTDADAINALRAATAVIAEIVPGPTEAVARKEADRDLSNARNAMSPANRSRRCRT
jgi:hypothetical protein